MKVIISVLLLCVSSMGLISQLYSAVLLMSNCMAESSLSYRVLPKSLLSVCSYVYVHMV